MKEFGTQKKGDEGLFLPNRLGTPSVKQIDDGLFKTRQAAEFLNTTDRQLEIWRQTGGGPPFVKLSPRAVRYRKYDLEKWIESRIKTSTAQP